MASAVAVVRQGVQVVLKGDLTILPAEESADPDGGEAVLTSTTGRPRRTTDSQVEIILKWHAEYRAWRAGRPAIPTVRALARHLGLSRGTITDVIRRHGGYKQASPERRVIAQRVRDRVIRRIQKER
jgi:transposase